MTNIKKVKGDSAKLTKKISSILDAAYKEIDEFTIKRMEEAEKLIAPLMEQLTILDIMLAKEEKQRGL